MKNKNLLYIIFAILVLVAVYFLMREKKVEVDEVNNPTEVQEEDVSSTQWPSDEIEKIKINDSGKKFSINFSYPKTESVAITKYFEDFANKQVAQFKDDTSWINDPALEADESSMNVSLNGDYQNLKSGNVQNYIFNISTDTGGAHGISTITTFSFLKSGERITLDNLFVDKSEGLNALSEYVTKEIKSRNINPDTKWIEEGTSPSIDNYKSFTIDNDGITVYLDPYQVAAYSAGPQKVSVPYSVVSKYLNPSIINQE